MMLDVEETASKMVDETVKFVEDFIATTVEVVSKSTSPEMVARGLLRTSHALRMGLDHGLTHEYCRNRDMHTFKTLLVMQHLFEHVFAEFGTRDPFHVVRERILNRIRQTAEEHVKELRSEKSMRGARNIAEWINEAEASMELHSGATIN